MIVTDIVSLDGHYDGRARKVVAPGLDGLFAADCAGRLRTADTLLVGGTPVVLGSGCWPPVADKAVVADELHLVIASLVLGGGTRSLSEWFSASLGRPGTRTLGARIFEDSEKALITSALAAA